MNARVVTFCLFLASTGCLKEGTTPPLENKSSVISTPDVAPVMPVQKSPRPAARNSPARTIASEKPRHAKSSSSNKTVTTASSSENVQSNIQATVATSIMAPPAQPEAKKFLATELDLSAQSNMRQTNDPDYQAASALMVRPTMRLSSVSALRTTLLVEQKLYGDQETALKNTTLELIRDPLKMNHDRDLNLVLYGVLPTNETDRIDATFRGSAGAAVGLAQRFGFLRNTATVAYAFSALKNVHEFAHGADYSGNLSHRLGHTVTYSQPLTKIVKFEMFGRYQTGWTYQDSLKTNFTIYEEIGFTVAPETELYLRHSNESDALQANGVDSNIKMYDGTSSTISTGLTATF